jgi:hypothetical protein
MEIEYEWVRINEEESLTRESAISDHVFRGRMPPELLYLPCCTFERNIFEK